MNPVLISYLNEIVSRFEGSKEEKQELKMELEDHLSMLLQEYIRKGDSVEKATELTI
jgi:hypothetical protein